MKIFSKLVLVLLCFCIVVGTFASCNISFEWPQLDDSEGGDGDKGNTSGKEDSNLAAGGSEGSENQSGSGVTDQIGGTGGNAGGSTNSGNSGSGTSEPGNSGTNSSDIPVIEYFDITFVNNNGEKDYVRTYKSNNVYAPSGTPKRENYTFVGWCKDEDCEKFFDFDTVLTENITLYAKWALDYESLNYKVTHEAMKFNVKVTTDFQLTEINRSDKMQGSGVIFYEEAAQNNFINYYVLTNNHVTDYTMSYSSRKFEVFDYRGNKFSANFVASDPNYDLAVLRFQAPATMELASAKIQLGVPAFESLVIGLGAPLGQFNTISYGKVCAFQILDAAGASDPRSNVRFEVIYHDAYSNNGSSGGPVVDINFNIIAINYASGKDDQGNFTQGFAVGSDKVVEFLSANGITYMLSDGTVVVPTADDNAA